MSRKHVATPKPLLKREKIANKMLSQRFYKSTSSESLSPVEMLRALYDEDACDSNLNVSPMSWSINESSVDISLGKINQSFIDDEDGSQCLLPTYGEQSQVSMSSVVLSERSDNTVGTIQDIETEENTKRAIRTCSLIKYMTRARLEKEKYSKIRNDCFVTGNRKKAGDDTAETKRDIVTGNAKKAIRSCSLIKFMNRARIEKEKT